MLRFKNRSFSERIAIPTLGVYTSGGLILDVKIIPLYPAKVSVPPLVPLMLRSIGAAHFPSVGSEFELSYAVAHTNQKCVRGPGRELRTENSSQVASARRPYFVSGGENVIVYYEFLKPAETINIQRYSQQMINLNHALIERRPGYSDFVAQQSAVSYSKTSGRLLLIASMGHPSEPTVLPRTGAI
ncbi:hypothetical protein TNCV_227171 [Trichonephila clavipes]|nr:hypothetical protein TNCV_227171 [Trichonephila clavipes]